MKNRVSMLTARLFSYIKINPKKALLGGIVLIGLSYYGYSYLGKTSTETQYVLGAVTQGTLITSVSGTGQVEASNELDIKPKVAGDIVWVGVKAGDTVHAGQALFSLDATDARQAVTDAEQSLAQAKLQLQKDGAQAPIDYQKALEAQSDANTNLATEYNTTFTTLSNTYLSLPAVMTGSDSILYGYVLSTGKSQWNVDVIKNIFSDNATDRVTINTFADIAIRDYKVAREKYDASLINYKKITRYSTGAELEAFLAESIDTATAVTQSAQSELNFLDTAVDIAQKRSITLSAAITTMQANGRTYLASANSALSSVLAQQRAIDTDKRDILNNERAITLLKVGNPDGTKPISLQASENSIESKERDLKKLRSTLSDYTIVAPFAGTIATVGAEKYDSVGTGSSVAKLITSRQVATLSLNEVDAAKVAAGQKVTLTFDAIDGFTMDGTVESVDTIGAVSQGVVSYTVRVAFNTQDVRIKPGMSTSATIITATKENVLLVPNSAVKNQSGRQYVEILEQTVPVASALNTTVPTTRGTGQYRRTGQASTSFPGGFNRASGTPRMRNSSSTGMFASSTMRLGMQQTGQYAGETVTSPTAPVQKPIEIGLSNDSYTEVVRGLSAGELIIVKTIAAAQTAVKTTTAASSLLSPGGRSAAGGVRIPR